MSARLLFTMLLIMPYSWAFSQTQSALVKGKVNISINEGTIDCDLVIEDIPSIEDYYILLNAGMNIEYIRDEQDTYSYYYEKSKDNATYEATAYYLPNNSEQGKFLRSSLIFKYTGKFPVYTDTIRPAGDDWKGNIAFNGYSLRMDADQSAWYPILFDAAKDKDYSDVRYDIEINCKECSSIYLNGSDPVPGSYAHLKSDKPMPMLLYVGKYKVKSVDGTFFLNPDVEDNKLRAFGEMTNKVKEYYTQQTMLPYIQNITYLNTTPVSTRNSWMFVTYPTIAIIGREDFGMKSVIEDTTLWSWTFIAHELAHYYSGSLIQFNSPIGDALSEGFAEYMSSLAIKAYFGEGVYKKMVAEWIENTKDFKPVPLSKVNSEQDYKNRQLYVYNYIPLLLTAIEKEVGTEQMWNWIRYMLNNGADYTDYKYLISTVSKSFKNEEKVSAIKEKYFESNSSLQNAVTEVK